MKIAILGTVHPKGLEFLKNNEFEVFEVGNFEIQSLKESLKNVDGILLRTSKLDKDILQHCDNLKIISRHGVGYDNVDLDFLNNNKIALGITSTSNAASVSEHVMSFFIYLTKNLSLSDSLVKEGNFDKRSQLPDFFELYKKMVFCIKNYELALKKNKISKKSLHRFLMSRKVKEYENLLIKFENK